LPNIIKNPKGISASCRARENAGSNSAIIDFKKGLGISDWSSSSHGCA